MAANIARSPATRYVAAAMPELPEVETVCRGLAACLQGRRLLRLQQRRPDLRIPLPEGLGQRLAGRRFERIDRRAKFILMHFDDDQVLICHLGMTGRMLVGQGEPELEAHDHVVFFAEGDITVRFNDARRFGLMALSRGAELTSHKLLAGLGPEPLGPDFNGPTLAQALAGKRTPIKAALLDQRVVAGIGNIYASEALFRAGISPRRSAHTVQGERAAKLARAVRAVLSEAIKAGGSSLRDYVQTDGELGYFQHRWRVYEREGQRCRGCDCEVAATGGIRRIVQSGRASFYCPRKQR
jgi:formamidopyrimidine-DNA glycosylase